MADSLQTLRQRPHAGDHNLDGGDENEAAHTVNARVSLSIKSPNPFLNPSAQILHISFLSRSDSSPFAPISPIGSGFLGISASNFENEFRIFPMAAVSQCFGAAAALSVSSVNSRKLHLPSRRSLPGRPPYSAFFAFPSPAPLIFFLKFC